MADAVPCREEYVISVLCEELVVDSASLTPAYIVRCTLTPVQFIALRAQLAALAAPWEIVEGGACEAKYNPPLKWGDAEEVYDIYGE